MNEQTSILMKNKSTEELKQEYEILKFLLDFHVSINPKNLKSKEWEEYINAALETMREIKNELTKRGIQF